MKINFITSIDKKLWINSLSQKFFFDPYIWHWICTNGEDMNYTYTGKAHDIHGDLSHFISMQTIVKKHHKSLLPKISEHFAEIQHMGSRLFWLRFLNFHLREFIGVCYFTFDRLNRSFSSTHHRLKIYADNQQCLYGDFGEMRLKTLSHTVSDLLVAEYMRLFFPGLCEEIVYRQLREADPDAAPPPAKSFWTRLRSKHPAGLLAAIARRVIPLHRTRMGLYQTSLNGVDSLFLHSLGTIREVDKPVPAHALPIQMPKNQDLRDRLCEPLSASDDRFERYFSRCLHALCPWIVAEGFSQAYAHYEHCWKNLPHLSHVVMESWMLNQKNLLSVLVAGERGIKWVYHEHVACNMLAASSLSYDIMDIPDIYLSSGWGKNHGNFIRGGSLYPMNTKRAKLNFDILFMLAPQYAYMGSTDEGYTYLCGEKNLETMQKFLKQFFSSLSSATLKKFLLKKHPRHDKYADMYAIDYTKVAGKNLHFANENLWNGRELMSKSKLTVINYISTPVFEALNSNFPCIIAYPDERYIWNDTFKYAYENLKSVGMIFTDPYKAAIHIESIKDDPESWWMTPEVQKARQEFCKKYFDGPQSALRELRNICRYQQ